MEQIIEHIKKNYQPLSIIVYGSYADGSNNEHSDFDALVISKSHRPYHDVSFVGGIQMDIFVYPVSYFDDKYDREDFIQISDGEIIMDTGGIGASLKKRITDYIESLPAKTPEEIYTEIEWCKKMLLRTRRKDAEGMFRWHWMLTDSLEIFCDAVYYPYRGPKKSLRWMEKQYPEAFACYTEALTDFSGKTTENWILYLEKMAGHN